MKGSLQSQNFLCFLDDFTQYFLKILKTTLMKFLKFIFAFQERLKKT